MHKGFEGGGSIPHNIDNDYEQHQIIKIIEKLEANHKIIISYFEKYNDGIDPRPGQEGVEISNNIQRKAIINYLNSLIKNFQTELTTNYDESKPLNLNEIQGIPDQITIPPKIFYLTLENKKQEQS